MDDSLRTRAPFKTLVFTPAGSVDATLAVAACRAGAIGILNLELLSQPALYAGQLDTLIGHAGRGEFGIKTDVLDDATVGMVRGAVDKGLAYLVFPAGIVASNSRLLKELSKKGVEVLAEVTSSDVDVKQLEKSASGILLKGHESGGLVGEESSFILSQHWLDRSSLPLYIRGGVTPHVASACMALGFQGCVLDSQLLLLAESPLRASLKPIIANLAGTETVASGDGEQGSYFRLLQRPGNRAAKAFIAKAAGCSAGELAALCIDSVDWADPGNGILPVGQDVGFAAQWAGRYGRLSAVIKAIDQALDQNLVTAAAVRAISRNSPLAVSLGVELPIVQGPMTRVSDSARFAQSVAEGGALPMLAFALLKGEKLEQMLQDARKLLPNRPFGIGLLGFAPRDLLDHQIATARKFNPDYAIIAGGRPDQAASLEQAGIPSFLHVPSRNLLSLFIKDGARRFIFEGRECGGHIGPLSSFVLWSSVIDCLLEELDKKPALASELTLLFAGGLHDAASSAAIQVMLAPLTRLGVKVGILMGSAYLFTEEIVTTEAIVAAFQNEALQCHRTVSLESGPGHASRCAYTPFAKSFFDERQRQLLGDLPPDEVRGVLDDLILGRLRIASKGTMRDSEDGSLVELDEARQRVDGMYMLGQVATLRDRITTVADLHNDVSEGAGQRLVAALQERIDVAVKEVDSLDIAIVGMASLFPQADTTEAYWQNIIDKVDAITEIPAHRWDWRLYFDEDRHARDKIYSKWGGFLDDLAFDPTRFGMPPKSLTAIDPMQLMALEVARRTLADAGYEDQDFDREHTSVIVGASGGAGDVGMQYGLRSELPRFNGQLPDGIAEQLPEWSEDTFAGILINVIAGRIANRLNLGGVNFTTDAACASSLAAIYQGISELVLGHSNMVISGGVDTVQGPFGYLCFSQTQALSPRGRCRTFDAGGDGIVISEGLAMLAMKRLEDAERDGDRIYCVIKGAGGSSDGKAKGLTAPLPAGQLRAMRGAYAQAGYGPDSVGLFEAHGTGTVAGDTAELESTTTLVREGGGQLRSAVVGSVKTMIGHTKGSAGIAGLIKVAMSLHHKVLPPHMGVDNPNAVLADPGCPLYLLDQARPWLNTPGTPRRASASAFGFGGTNFHVTVEEYTDEYRPWLKSPVMSHWPAELFVWQGADPEEIREQVQSLLMQLQGAVDLELRDVSRAVIAARQEGPQRAFIVVRGLDELADKLPKLLLALDDPSSRLPPGMGVSRLPEQGVGKVAFLFSGQGSQYTEMLRELSVYLPVCRDALGAADASLAAAFSERFGTDTTLSQFMFPRGCYTEAEQREASRLLTNTDVAQPALGAVSTALFRLLQQLGLGADMLGGHSYGEFVALHAAGSYDFETLMSLSEARGRLIVDSAGAAGAELGTMAAVQADRALVEEVISGIADVIVANHNAPRQVIISGSSAGIEAALAAFAERDIDATGIPVAAAFHSKFVRPAQQGLAQVIENATWHAPSLPVYANTTGALHDSDPEQVKATMIEHLVRPVEFVSQLQSMYDDGASIFIEVGPKAVLTRLVGRILEGKPHTAIALDDLGGGMFGLLVALGELACAGVEFKLDTLFAGRDCLDCDLDELAATRRHALPSKQTWMINGSGVRRLDDPIGTVGLNLDVDSVPLLVPAGTAPAAVAVVQAPSSSPQIAPIASAPKAKPLLSERGTRSMGKYQKVNNVSGGVMAEYFATMRQFLATQEAVMSGYLGATPGVQLERLDTPRTGLLEAFVPDNLPSIEMPRMQPAVAATVQPASSPPAPAPGPPAAAPPPQPAAVAPEVAGSAAASGAMDREGIEDKLYAIIEDTTGYPKDMVGPDQNLEGDLGIDSIKRVEIVGNLLQALPSVYADTIGDGRKELVSAPSLNDMLDILEKLEAGAPAEGAPAEGAPAEAASPFDQAGVDTGTAAQRRLPRHLIKPELESIPANAVRVAPSGVILITEDRQGIGRALSGYLQKQGCDPRLVSVSALLEVGGLDFLASLESIGGLVHLASVDAQWLSPDTAMQQFENELRRNEQAFFMLLSRALPLLDERAGVMAVSALGGNFFHTPNSSPSPGLSLQGGGVGLLKSLREERPTLRCRAIDLDSDLDAGLNASLLLEEYTLASGRVEVGYPAGERTIFRTVVEDHGLQFAEQALADKPLVVLATGGARGITAEVLRPLAKPGNKLILTGRSQLLEESAQTRGLQGEEALQKHFFSAIRSGESDMTPLQVKNAIGTILAQREMQQNIEQFRRSGAEVAYHSVDVSDEALMTEFMDRLYQEYGTLHGVVHGAGIIEDKKVEDKSPDSWMRVLSVKVKGLLCLQKLVNTDELKFFTVFSSVAGRYGNSGQSDYATANELMNRVCQQLHALWGEEVLVKAFCWGPWGSTRFGSGMVTSEVEAKFGEKGVLLVGAEQGAAHFVDELSSSPETVEVISGEGPWDTREAELGEIKVDTVQRASASAGCATDVRAKSSSVFGALIGPGQLTVDPKGEQTIDFVLDARHAYLQDHLIDGSPVLPAAVALDMMAEAVGALWPDWVLTEVQQVRLMKGVELGDQPLPMSVLVVPAPYGDAGGFEVQVLLQSGDANEKTVHYRCVARLEQELAAPPFHKARQHADKSISAAFAYSDWLFHGPRFQLILNIHGLSERGSGSALAATRPAEWLTGAGDDDQWTFDPGVIDAAPQMALIWGRRFLGKSALPARFERVVRYTEVLPENLEMCFEIREDSMEYKVMADVYFCDGKGRVLMAIEGMECVASEKLNRLGGTAAGGSQAQARA